MHDAGGGGRLGKDQQRAADDADTLPCLGRPAPVGAAGVEPPVGIVGVGRHHGDLVALANQTGGHLAGVLADPGELGGKVDAVEQPAAGRLRCGPGVDRSQHAVDGRQQAA